MVNTLQRWLVTLLPMAFGCNAIVGIVPGDPRPPDPCHTVADCLPVVPECQSAKACVDYVCQYDNVIENAPLSEQIAGDCIENVCDGAGGMKKLVTDVDVADDGNPCTLEGCRDGVPTVLIVDKQVACYSGPKDVLGTGVCKEGVWHCAADGTPLECYGEVLPSEEVCDVDEQDEDCDGQTNESGIDCVCLPGDKTTCYTGAPDTLHVGVCHEGLASCAKNGLGFDVCLDEQVPTAEDCDMMGMDEDCDGRFNESGISCQCGDGWFSDGEACEDGNVSNADACSSTCARTIPSLALGGFHTCALLLNGSVKCWGRNDDGQLGLGDTAVRGDMPGEIGASLPAVFLGTATQASAVSAGSYHTCALLVDGRVKCWGRNLYGQLGLGDNNSRGTTAASMGDGLPAVSLGMGLIVQSLALGGHHSCALFQGGSVKCWGRNDSGQLGLGTTDHRGDNANEMGNALPFVDLGTGIKATAIAAGSAHTCALLENGSIKCWGYGGRGQLGLGSSDNRGDGPNEMGDQLSLIEVDAGQKVVAIVAAGDHTCVLLEDARLKCWGANGSGELGLGDTADRSDTADEPVTLLPFVSLGDLASVRSVVSGAFHTCAVLQDDRVKCWGLGTQGALGLEDTQTRGDGINEMGDMLPVLQFGGPVKALFAGAFHSCVTLVDGTVRCWGENATGQLGLGDTARRGDDVGEMGAFLPEVRPY